MSYSAKQVKHFDLPFIIAGALFIVAGIFADHLMVWIDQITLSNIENCIADMHFRHNNEDTFLACVSTDLGKIEAILHWNTFTTILFSLGGVFIGLGFRTQLKSEKQIETQNTKQNDCNCNTPYRCPKHDE